MNRVLVARTPLGETWWATSLEGKESLSSLYEFRLELKSKESNIDTRSLIGEACSVSCEGSRGAIRHFSGLIVSAAAKGRSGRHWLYEVLIAPKLWYASRRSDFKIFQEQTVQAIADQILQQNAIVYEWRLKNNHKTWEYVVQYGETDLAFLLRLLGYEGIYFWFEHEEGGEKLILADHFSTHVAYAGYENIPYDSSDNTKADEDHFYAWHARHTAEPGRFVLASYDFKHPSRNLETEYADPRGHMFDQYEIYDYPGAYTEPEYGQEYAEARLHGMQADHDVIVLEGSVRGAIPGYTFTLVNHPVDSENREFTIIKAVYRARNNDYESKDGAQEEADFYVKITAIPFEHQYRTPSDKFRMPRSHGPDTAVVVGPPGIEIYNDKYGRVKVHFHWDRYGNKDGQDSCWVRVASPWAGTSVGVISVPRVGQEVVVDYEHGDPQRPLITGCVYNAQQMPPWGLPTSNTQSGLMSRSTPGGMADNFNAVRFENAKGSEKLWIHAERDMDVDVKNNLDVDVGADHRETIHGKRDITVKQGDKLTVESGGRTEIINGAELHVTEGKRTEIIDQGRKVTVKEEDELRVKGGQKVRIGDGQEVTIEGRQGVTIGGGQEVTIETGDHMTKVVEGGYTVHAKGEIKHISDATKYEWITGLSNSLTGVSNSVTGVSNSVTGLSGDITGLSVDITGLSVDITGLSVDIKGIEIGEKPIEIHNKNVEVNINTAVNVAIAVINLEMLNLTVVM